MSRTDFAVPKDVRAIEFRLCFDLQIPKTCLYNFDPPLKPHFYIVKLGFTGVYIIFIIYTQKHRLWVLGEPPRQDDSNEYPQYMFWAEM